MPVITRTAAIAALLLASACSGQPEVLEPDPTTSPTAAATPSPTPPPTASERSKTGAANFVSFWFEQSDYAAVTGDVAGLKRISASNCGTCNEFIDLYSKTYAEGGSFTGGSQRLENVTAEMAPGGDAVLISADVTLAAGTYQEDARSSPEAVRAEKNSVTARVDWTDVGWTLSELIRDE